MSVTMAFAGDKSENNQTKSTKKSASVSEQTSAHQSEMKQEQKQKKDQKMEQKQEANQLCFETKDGKTFTWQNRYNKRLMKYQEKENTKKMNRYLYRIAKRIGINDPQEIEEFIQWAMNVEPWTEGEVEQ